MLPRSHPDGIHIAFDDHRLVNNAGLILPSTLARHLGLPQLVQQRLDLDNAPGRANPGDKMMTLVASALAGGDCIDDADVLRTGRTAGALGCAVKAPSTLGTFLRSFRWGHLRQLDRVSRELLARAWAAGAGPGGAPLTIDLDSTICETYPLRAYPKNWLKIAGALREGKRGLRLDWGNDQSERPQSATSEACWPSHQDQSYHRRVPDLRRALGGAGAVDPQACEHPSFRRRSAPGP